MKRPIEELIIGDSPVIKELRQNVLRFAPLDLNVVIMGPTGSGKELVAQALHEYSGRRGAFVPTNVCAIPETMFESTMFGHRRGAFTGAVADSQGLMREADTGTLFLDEMGDLGLASQVKLLRAIDTGRFRPVGATADARSDFRTVAATNRDVPAMVRERGFREDLWFRLSGVLLRVPPLSARVEDIPRIAAEWLRMSTGASVPLNPAGARALAATEWPGQVRELKHVVTLAAALCNGAVDADAVASALVVARGAARGAVDGDPERAAMLRLLEEHDWRPSAVAAATGMHIATLYRRFERLGIRVKLARARRASPSAMMPS